MLRHNESTFVHFWPPLPDSGRKPNANFFSLKIFFDLCFLNICCDYAAEHEITFNCNKTYGVLFCPKKYKQPAPSDVFLNGVRVQFLDQVKYLGVWINASLKDDDDIQRQVKSLYCSANKLRGTFDQCSTAVKSTLFRAYCMPLYAC